MRETVRPCFFFWGGEGGGEGGRRGREGGDVHVPGLNFKPHHFPIL